MVDHEAGVSGDRAETEPVPTPVHGGRLLAAMRAFPDAPRPWIDLSTGISPHAYPVGELPPETWTRLPEPEQVAELERVAGVAYGAGPGWEVVAAPGTSALIAALAGLCPGPAAIVGPTYGEYHAGWPGALVVAVPGAAFRARGVRIVCQPDNPTGRMHDPAELLRGVADGVTVVDESYADFAPGASVVPGCADPAGAVVLRSFGKAYGLAGLRLGFALTGRAMAGRLRRALGPWPVSGAAVRVGTAALADAGWRAAVAARLAGEGARLDGMLAGAGFTGMGGTALFRVGVAPGAGWFEWLAGRGVLVRAFVERPGFLRFGLPGNEGAWERLEALLSNGRNQAG